MLAMWTAWRCAECSIGCSEQALAHYLSIDHDPLFRYHRWQANLQVLEIEPVKTVSYVPLSHPFV